MAERHHKKKKDNPTLTPRASNPISRPLPVEPETRVTVTEQLISQEYSGDVPPPAFARDYEEVMDGATDRMFKMAEKALEMQAIQQAHVNLMEAKVVEANITIAKEETEISGRGQILIFLVVLAFISAATVLLALGMDVGGFTVLAGALAPIIALLLYRKDQPQKNDGGKNQK